MSNDATEMVVTDEDRERFILDSYHNRRGHIFGWLEDKEAVADYAIRQIASLRAELASMTSQRDGAETKCGEMEKLASANKENATNV